MSDFPAQQGAPLVFGLLMKVMAYIVLSFTVPAVMLSHRGRARSYPEDTALLAQNNLKYSRARSGTSRAHAKI